MRRIIISHSSLFLNRDVIAYANVPSFAYVSSYERYRSYSIHTQSYLFFLNNPLPYIEIVAMSVFCWSHSFSYFQIHMIQSSRERKTLQTFDRFSKSIHECTLLCNETSSNTSSSISIIDSFRLFSHLTPSLILRLVRERTWSHRIQPRLQRVNLINTWLLSKHIKWSPWGIRGR